MGAHDLVSAAGAAQVDDLAFGCELLAGNPDHPGSLGIAISEAVMEAAADPQARYTLGSVLNHVCLHQTVIGQEAKQALAAIGDYPDVVIGCVGGGSSFAGLAFPFLQDRLTQGRQTRFLAVEPAACPSLTKGKFAYDFGDAVGMTPMVKMFTLGHTFMPAGIHAGGLRYHGMAPLISALVATGDITPVAYHQNPVFAAAVKFARTEGIIPAPESAHAIVAAIDEALDAKAKGEERVIVFNLSGHGFFDMTAYDQYLAGNLVDYEYPADAVAEALQHLTVVG